MDSPEEGSAAPHGAFICTKLKCAQSVLGRAEYPYRLEGDIISN